MSSNLVMEVELENPSLSLKMYSEEDLLDSLVVDKEGYICGRVSGFDVEPDLIAVRLYEYEMKKFEVPDEEGLIQRLLPLAPKKLSRRELDMEEFYNWIRAMIQLSNKEPVTLEHLIAYAKKNNIDVPYRAQEVKEKIDKGSIQWSSIAKIAFSELGRCVLFKDMVEAMRRGVPPSGVVAYKSTEFLRGRIVLDSEAKIVGSAVKFLVGDPPGILINVERVFREERGDAEALKKMLIPSKFKDENEFARRVKKELNIENASDDDLIVWATKKKEITVPRRTVERRETMMELPVEWSKIAKIGDVIILTKPLEELTRQPNMDFPELPNIAADRNPVMDIAKTVYRKTV